MNTTPPDGLTFEQSLAQLEQIVHDLEDAQLGLDEALGRYEQGVGLIKHCQALLQQAEQRILLLTDVGDDGQPVLQAFKHEATASARAPAPRLKKPSDEKLF